MAFHLFLIWESHGKWPLLTLDSRRSEVMEFNFNWITNLCFENIHNIRSEWNYYLTISNLNENSVVANAVFNKQHNSIANIYGSKESLKVYNK